MKIPYRIILEELKAYLQVLKRHRTMPGVKFVIFSHGRSGSTLLVDLLNSHPQIHCDDELLRHRVIFPRLYIRARTLLSEEDVYGFKLLSYQIIEVQSIRCPEKFIPELNRGEYNLIYLKRQNVFHHALSNLYARHTGAFAHRSSEGILARSKMSVDLDALVRWIKGIQRTQEFEDRVLTNVPHVNLCYENDLREENMHQATIDRLAKYLGIPPAPVKTDLVKIIPRSLSDIVENYVELREFIANSEYAQYFVE